MRLKVFRDSVEDFDYFAALAKLAGRDEADRVVKDVASSFRTYSRNPSDYTEARKLIAKKILEKMQH